MMTTRRSLYTFLLLMLAFCAIPSRFCVGAEASGEAFFPIMSWEVPPRCDEFGDPKHGLASLAECGFTVAGFVRPEHLKECERLGLRAIVGRPGGRVLWEKMSDAEIEQTVRSLVEDGRGSPAVIGYFITDEPGVSRFPALAKAAAHVKKLAPDKIAYMNLFPDYAT